MPRPKTIDRTAILQAALDIADTGGVPALSMQAVATRLAVTPMALYRHVANKADLLDGIVELLMAEIMADAPAPDPDGGRDAWLDALIRTAGRARAVASRHPAAFTLLLSRPAATTAAREVRAHIHGLLRQAGVGGEHVERLERIVTTTVLGMAAGQASDRFAHHAPGVLDEDVRALARFVTAGIEPFRSSEERVSPAGVSRAGRRASR
ncbi:hypothetical protein GCM10010517_44350 [Streptosporangium fragile]|uniref:HTH tetR-type domain-containing protein n=1 Tax=Streptosporangium fragile TaxID=46186 RepID=A0ABP6IGM6_9ACTN